MPDEVIMQIQWDIERSQVDWIMYQGGIGTRFNPIIVEDD